MVLLTMTSAVVEVIQKLQKLEELKSEHKTEEEAIFEDSSSTQDPKEAILPDEPSLQNPAIGNPVSHNQILNISKQLKSHDINPYHLDLLLRGSKVYIPPPPPKKEPTAEYKALMARLRREEEARSYERMINPPAPIETFSQRFPTSSAAYAFSSSHKIPSSEDDEITYNDINRQITVIFNVLVSIVACAVAIWVAARYRSTPVRLALSMAGSIIVGIAEVVVYGGYIRKLGEAKGDAKKVKEVKEVVKTWVIDENWKEESENSGKKVEPEDAQEVRRRVVRQGEKT